MRGHSDVFSGLIASSYKPLQMRGDGRESQIVNGGFAGGSFFFASRCESRARPVERAGRRSIESAVSSGSSELVALENVELAFMPVVGSCSSGLQA
jgi:hypothetical protein